MTAPCTKQDRYALARLDGMSDTEARQHAGYASEAPAVARELHAAMEGMMRGGGTWATPEHYQGMIDGFATKVRRLKVLMRAAELLQNRQRSGAENPQADMGEE